MEQNNFLRLPTGMRDVNNRAMWAEDSGYWSYRSPIECLYHLFDLIDSLRCAMKEVDVWMITQLLICAPLSEAGAGRADRDRDLYRMCGNQMFPLDERHIYDIVHALSMGAPAEFQYTRGEIAEEWRLYKARGGKL